MIGFNQGRFPGDILGDRSDVLYLDRWHEYALSRQFLPQAAHERVIRK